MDTQPSFLVDPSLRRPFMAMPWRQVEPPQEDEVDDDDPHREPPSQTWKHPDDGKELPERDREVPLKP